MCMLHACIEYENKREKIEDLSFILTLNLSNLQDNKEERNGDMNQYRASPITERKKTTSRLHETKESGIVQFGRMFQM